MVTTYLANRPSLVLSIQIVDSRHEPTKQDLELHEWLVHYGKPHFTVATKSDKLSQNELRKSVERARLALGGEVLTYSAVSGHGREEVWRRIARRLTEQ